MTVSAEEEHESGIEQYYGKHFIELFHSEFRPNSFYLEYENPDKSVLIVEIYG